MPREIFTTSPPPPHSNGQSIVLELVSAEALTGLPSWITIDNDNQQLVVADAPAGTFQSFTLEATGLDDTEPDPVWIGSTSLDITPNTTIPFSTLWSSTSDKLCVRDSSADPVIQDIVENDMYTDTPSVYQFQPFYTSSYSGSPTSFGNGMHDGWGAFNPANLNASYTNYGFTYGYTDHPHYIEYPYQQGVPPEQQRFGDNPNKTPGTYLPWWKGEMFRPWNFPAADGFQVEEVGLRNHALGVYRGVSFVNGCPSAYQYFSHILDQNRWDPAEEVNDAQIVDICGNAGTGDSGLPAGFRFSNIHEWGEIISDGDFDPTMTPGEEKSFWYILRVSSPTKTQDRAVRIRIMEPQYVYGPTGTHDPTTTGTRQFVLACRDHYGQDDTCIVAFEPFDLDVALNNSLSAQTSAAYLFPWGRDLYREHHVVCRNHLDRTQFFNANGANNEHNDTQIEGLAQGSFNPITANTRRPFRQTVQGCVFRGIGFNYRLKLVTLQNCKFIADGSGDSIIRAPYFCMGPRDNIQGVTFRDVESGFGGSGLDHAFYVHLGTLARLNIDAFFGHDTQRGQCAKAFPGGEVYMRNCLLVQDEKFLDGSFDIAAHRANPTMADQCMTLFQGLRRKIIADNTFVFAKFTSSNSGMGYGNRTDGKPRAIEFQARHEFWNGFHPIYGTSEFFNESLWLSFLAYGDQAANDPAIDYVSATQNPDNRGTHQTYMSGNQFLRYQPAASGGWTITPDSMQIYLHNGSYPNKAYPPGGGGSIPPSSYILGAVPNAWHERGVVFWADDNVIGWHPNSPYSVGEPVTAIIGTGTSSATRNETWSTDIVDRPSFDVQFVSATGAEEWFRK